MQKVIIQKLTHEELKQKGVFNWSIWEKEISKFDWFYDSEEHCYFLEGEVIVETQEGNFSIKKGDFVEFKQGLKCVWNVLKPVKKHYLFF